MAARDGGSIVALAESAGASAVGGEADQTRTPSERRRRERHKRIFEAGVRLFAKNGFGATTMADIAAAADLTPAALYRYFPSKRAILDLVFETSFHITDEEYRQHRERLQPLPLREALVVALELGLRAMKRNEHLLHVIFSEAIGGDAVAAGRHAETMDLWIRHIVGVLEDHPDSAPSDAGHRTVIATALIYTCFGLFVEDLMQHSPFAGQRSEDEVVPRPVLQEIVRRLLLAEPLDDGSRRADAR